MILNIHFWGVRGSIPAPLSPQQIQSKIMAAVQRIKPEDLTNQETRAKFISNLPSWIFGTIGGNTPCIEIIHNNTDIILDAGTGLRVLGKNRKNNNHFHILFSHFHWDHIQGLPFFDPIFNPKTTLDIYSPWKETEEFLTKQTEEPFSPPSVPKSITKNINYNIITPGKNFLIDDIKVNSIKMNHPGTSYCYSFEAAGRKFIYATDVELNPSDFTPTEEAKAFFSNADAIVMDSQYTVEEAQAKKNWGHNAFCYAVDFAIQHNIKKLYLFHHEPTYDDKKLNSILQAARWYAQYINHSDLKIFLAQEGHEFNL